MGCGHGRMSSWQYEVLWVEAVLLAACTQDSIKKPLLSTTGCHAAADVA
jgi:hypothetical protein